MDVAIFLDQVLERSMLLNGVWREALGEDDVEGVEEFSVGGLCFVGYPFVV